MAIETIDPHHQNHVQWKLEDGRFYHKHNKTKWVEMRHMHITPMRVKVLYKMMCEEKLITPDKKPNIMRNVIRILLFFAGIFIVAAVSAYCIIHSISLSIWSWWRVFKLLSLMGIGIFVGIRIMAYSLKD